MLERIAGTKVPGDDPLIKQMEQLILKGKRQEAAELALSHQGFLNVTVKQMGLKMSTREETTRVDLNDFTASIIGVTRDDQDARTLLTGNFFYMGDSTKLPSSATVRSAMVADLLNSNNHYKDLDKASIDLGKVLKRVEGQKIYSQAAQAAVANPDPAGVLTSRSFLSSHVIAGTNRRAVEYTFREFMCTTIEEWADAQAPSGRIGRDIDRNPGGSSAKFETSCKACHSVMDGFRGAFAFWNFQFDREKGIAWVANSMAETSLDPLGFLSSKVAKKLNHNESVYPGGYVTADNSWQNNAINTANNARFGWRGTSAVIRSGRGVAGLGAVVADSRRFSECMVKRVFESTCRPRVLSFKEQAYFVMDQANQFESSGYKLRSLFARVVASKECGQ